MSTGTTNDLNSIAYENGKYVAVGDGGTILVSTNISGGFSAVSSGTTENLTRVRYCNGHFIALGEGVILHNQNGTTWTAMRDVYGIPFTDAAFANGRYLIAAKDGDSGLLFTSQDPLDTFMAFEMAWYVDGKPLLTISPLENTVIVAGGGGYAAVGAYTGYGPQFFEFDELGTGIADDIRDMVWTDTYVGAVVGENGRFALNKFSGGAGVTLKYEPVPVATISSVGLIRPDNETTSVDRDGRLSVKPTVADYAMPGKIYTALTPGESGTTYVAPATGWVAASGTTDGTSGRLAIKNTATGLGSGDGYNNSSVELAAFLPIVAGDSFTVSYSGLASISLRFIYSKGNL